MKRALYFAMPLAVAIVIAWGAFSSVPPIPKLFEQQDKVEHLLAFGALSFWLLAALGPRRTVLAACLSVGAAVGLELVQHVLSATYNLSSFERLLGRDGEEFNCLVEFLN